METLTCYRAKDGVALHLKASSALKEELEKEMNGALKDALVENCRAFTKDERNIVYRGIFLLLSSDIIEVDHFGIINQWKQKYINIIHFQEREREGEEEEKEDIS